MEDKSIFDLLDIKYKAYLKKHNAAPDYLVLDLYSLIQLKDELNIPADDSLPSYKSCMIAVLTSEDFYESKHIHYA
jgi:hypothetical protein